MTARCEAHIRLTSAGHVLLERAVPSDSVTDHVQAFKDQAGMRPVTVTNEPGRMRYEYRDRVGITHMLLVTLPRWF